MCTSGNPLDWLACQITNTGQQIAGSAASAGGQVVAATAGPNWQDIGIRTGLILLGGIIIIIAVARLVHQPDVEVVEE
jgi:hypothetical protein